MRIDEQSRTLFLSRRNLKALLAKLDGFPPNSACTLVTADADSNPWFVVAEEDDSHYGGRAPGPMHEATEAAL